MRLNKVSIPPMNNDFAYFLGVLLADGSMPECAHPNHYPIVLALSDKMYLKDVYMPLIQKLFGINLRLEEKCENRPGKRLKMWVCRFKSKVLRQHLIQKLNIPSGKKAAIIQIPPIILGNSIDIQKHFLAGFFDSDGGVQGGAFGMHIASRVFRDQCTIILRSMNYKVSYRDCFNKKYNRFYYQLSLTKPNTRRLLAEFPLRNIYKIEKLSKLAGVPEWSLNESHKNGLF